MGFTWFNVIVFEEKIGGVDEGAGRRPIRNTIKRVFAALVAHGRCSLMYGMVEVPLWSFP